MFTCQIDDRLALRMFSVTDADEGTALIRRNLDRLALWMPWATPEFDAGAERAFLTGALERWSRGESLESWLTHDGAIIGSVGLVTIQRVAQWAEIGYWIDAAYEGRGFVSAAVRALEAMAFGELGCERVQICCDAANLRSAAVPERLGYTLEGTLRRALLSGAGRGVADKRVYALLKDEWQARATQVSSN